MNYSTEVHNLTSADLADGFFDGWGREHPSKEKHLEILRNSYRAVVAVDEETGQVIGFINAISDGVLSAYIPLLEVVPEWKAKGIGTELVQRMLKELDGLYMVDLLCDEALQPFYERVNMRRMQGMAVRNYSRASGK
ncbi:GNAT family N-acetyltransferase [Alteribacter lacisalsi]|uniref:GNAT family N-acetyltransferase n=1 Tax=Alteribacter lacisalsi TaxID=2045244 RepID=A0A2W0HHE9_9BACI|nr:GNAT family N-acetyltransferase [Alteribacter lacisalsi]PYZ96855.1 GNAT family N-acetyltransferase [Alteribacter lacisalsi]